MSIVKNELLPNLMMIDIDLLDIDDQPMPEQTPETEQQMEESITEHGVVEPLLVKEKPNGRYKIVAGRTRKIIAKKVGLKRVPCNVCLESKTLIDVQTLAYDLELFRRQLSQEEKKKLLKERNTIKMTSSSSLMESIMRKLTPEMRAIFNFKREKNELNKEWRALFYFISEIPQAEQRAFFERETEPAKADIEQQELIDTLNEKIDALEEMNSELQAKGRAYEKAKTEFAARLEERVAAVKAKLEAEYKEEITSDKIAAMIEAEKDNIAATYSKDLQEMNARLKELSKTADQANNEIQYLKEQLKESAKQHELQDQILKKKNAELEERKRVISTLANSKKIKQHLEITLTDIRNACSSISMLGEIQIEDSQREEILRYIGQIKDNVDFIENFITQKDGKKQSGKQKVQAG